MDDNCKYQALFVQYWKEDQNNKAILEPLDRQGVCGQNSCALILSNAKRHKWIFLLLRSSKTKTNAQYWSNFERISPQDADFPLFGAKISKWWSTTPKFEGHESSSYFVIRPILRGAYLKNEGKTCNGIRSKTTIFRICQFVTENE